MSFHESTTNRQAAVKPVAILRLCAVLLAAAMLFGSCGSSDTEGSSDNDRNNGATSPADGGEQNQEPSNGENGDGGSVLDGIEGPDDDASGEGQGESSTSGEGDSTNGADGGETDAEAAFFAEEALSDPELARAAALDIMTNPDVEVTSDDNGTMLFETAEGTVMVNVDNTMTYTNVAGTKKIEVAQDTDRASFIVDKPIPDEVSIEVVGADGSSVSNFPAPIYEALTVREVAKVENADGSTLYSFVADYPLDIELFDIAGFYADFGYERWDDTVSGIRLQEDDSYETYAASELGGLYLSIAEPGTEDPRVTFSLTVPLPVETPEPTRDTSVDPIELLTPGVRVTGEDGTVVEAFPFGLYPGGDVIELSQTMNDQGGDVFKLVVVYPNDDEFDVESYYSKLVRYGLNYRDTIGRSSSSTNDGVRVSTGSTETEEGQIYIWMSDEDRGIPRIEITIGERPEGWVTPGE